MHAAVIRAMEEGVDIYISAAAISDFAPKKITGKIPSGRPGSLN
jgi:phosphopantothenoylcysteine decarboxylase/phosphopantothenate--cysteine ligase